MYVQGYLQVSENGRVVTIGLTPSILFNFRYKKIKTYG